MHDQRNTFPEKNYMLIEAEISVKYSIKTYIEYTNLIKQPKVLSFSVPNIDVILIFFMVHYFKFE